MTRVNYIDTRTRVVVAGGLAAAVAAARTWSDLGALTVALILFYIWAGVPWRAVGRYLRPFVWLACIALLLAKGEAGATLIKVGQWRYTIGDAAVGLWTAGRLLLLVISVAWLTITTSTAALVSTLQSFLQPLKRCGIPVEAFSLAVLATLRLLPVIMEETRRIRQAQIARGVDWLRGWRGLWRRTASLVIPVFNAGIRRADQLADTLTVRGYRVGMGVESLPPLRVHDYILLLYVFFVLYITWRL